MGYEIVRYQPEFKEGVLKLLELLWSSNPAVNAACFEWKHERNPYQRDPLLYLALDGGRVVGMRGMCGAKWEAGVPRSEFDIPCACDLVVAADHRNRGLISRIMRFALDDLKRAGMEYVFSLSAGPITFMNALATGWRSIGPLQTVSRKITRETRAARLKKILGRWPPVLNLARSFKNLHFARGCAQAIAFASAADAEAPFSRLDRNFRSGDARSSQRLFLEESPRPEAMADLIRRIESDGRIRHVRDQRYFGWRFQDPLCQFRFLYWGPSRLEGYLILETTGPSLHGIHSRIKISDWEATNVQVFEDLLEAAIRLGEFDEISTWGRAVPGPARNVLDQAGFQPLKVTDGESQYGPTVLVRPTVDERNPAQWSLAGGRLLDAACWDVRPIYAL